MTVHVAILRSASLLVPAPQRAEWLAEWRAELWYVKHGATAFCLGAFRDAFWLLRNRRTPDARRTWGLESPSRCILFLAVLAALSVILAFFVPRARGLLLDRHFIPAVFLMVPLSFLILSATTSLSLGDYPANRHSRRWIFLTLKIVLLLPIVWCGSLDLASIISMGFQPHGFLVGSIFAARWALIDQRRRCPVCLRLLSSPTRIGCPSHAFLEWYGTELICDRGHGLLYVPEIPTSCCSTQRWQYLDRSWDSLFS